MNKIREKVLKDRRTSVVFPKSGNLFTAFKLTPYEKVRVVVLGQDPYHTPDHAHGLAFSSVHPHKCPPSLRNILTEVEEDVYNGLNLHSYDDWCLERWATQGVLLLNTAFTVVSGTPGAHIDLWKPFTLEVFSKLQEKTGLIYLLWGNYAKAFKEFINLKSNFILEAAHPSPYSANNGFFGCKHFSKVNEIISSQNGKEFVINW